MATDWRLWVKAKLMGRCSKRSRYGHWFVEGKCIECGKTTVARSRAVGK